MGFKDAGVVCFSKAVGFKTSIYHEFMVIAVFRTGSAEDTQTTSPFYLAGEQKCRTAFGFAKIILRRLQQDEKHKYYNYRRIIPVIHDLLLTLFKFVKKNMTYIRINTKSQQAKKFVELMETMPFAEILEEPNVTTKKAMEAAKKGKSKRHHNASDLIFTLNK